MYKRLSNILCSILLLLTSVIIIIHIGIPKIASHKRNETQDQILLDIGDRIDHIEVTDAAGTNTKLRRQNAPYQALFYIDDSHKSYKSELMTIKHLQGIFSNSNIIDITILWSNAINRKAIRKYGLTSSNHYSLKKNHLKASSFNTYLIDQNNVICYSTSITENLVSEILKLNGVEGKEVRRLTNAYLSTLFPHSQKEKLVFFEKKNCKRCSVFNQIKTDKDINRKYNMLIIQDQSSSNINDSDQIFKEIYNINKYPFFLILDNIDGKVINKADPGQIKQMLLD